MRGLILMLVLIVVAAGAVYGIGAWRFSGLVAAERTELFDAGGEGATSLVTADALTGLPAPVRRWLQWSGVVGRPRAQRVRLSQEGTFRTGPGQPWMAFRAEEYYTLGRPGFLWHARVNTGPLPTVRVRDRYMRGHGGMYVTLLGLLPLVDARGPALDQGSALRFLNEIMWVPSAALADYIAWHPLDGRHARATLVDGGREVAAVFEFDGRGRPVSMTAQRYRYVDGTAQLERWSTPMDGWGVRDGLRMPVSGEGVWHLAAGDFAYVRLRVTARRTLAP